VRATPKIFILIILAAIFVGVPYYLQNSISGQKPQVEYDTYIRDQNRTANFDENLTQLASAAESAPKDAVAWKKFANALASKIYSPENAGSNATQGLVIELIDALRHILDLEPNDPETLLSMANINYNFQVFDKAAEYFDQYLKINKGDHLSRATFGSALSFLGRFDEAEKELIYVTAQEPTFFLARANLAISYALAGNKDQASRASQEALPYAKDEETRAKFKGFLDDILNPKQPTEPVDAGPLPKKPSDPLLSGIEADIRNNPVAGPKFVYAKIDKDALILNFANFPMAAMPPFAKEKFFNTVRESVERNKLTQIKVVKFLDHGTNETMDSLDLKAN
jgi:tetratricopeptide (TPR) repeat protein